MFQSNAVILMALFLQLMGLTFAVVIDPYIRKRHRKIMLLIVAVVFSLIAQNCVEFLLDSDFTLPTARTIVGIYGYSVRPVIILLFIYIVSEKRNYRPAWILIGINAAIHLTALFSGVCFRIDETNHFLRGPLGYSCHVISGLLLLYLVFLTLREYARVRKWETAIPMFNTLLIIASVLLDSVADDRASAVSFLTVVTVSSSLFYYIWLHLQFVREHEQALAAEHRIRIMMSQIQPHFLYNTLSTIQALCRTDPDKAFDTLEKFGVYLRENIDSLRRTDLIPLKKELEHTRVYTEIEMLRFPSISVDFDIADADFPIPALSVQPLVENAIRHGVRIREHGVITVSTRREPGAHIIEIRDNGIGFDASALNAADETHIGIRNVRERIETMCQGTLTVRSYPEEGTLVTLRIPEREEQL